MKDLILYLALSCPTPHLKGFPQSLSEYDVWTLNNAKKRCGELFPKSPCLKVLERTGVNAYRATCGFKQ